MNQVADPLLTEAITALVKINGKSSRFQVDSGSPYTIVSEGVFNKIFGNNSPKLYPFRTILRGYSKKQVRIAGQCQVKVTYNNFTRELPLIVARGNNISLLGRNWFKELGICVSGVYRISRDRIQELMEEFPGVFKEGLGTYKGQPISIKLDPNVTPIRLKARRVPLGIRQKVDDELEKWVKQGILEPITDPEWATPIVPILKQDGSVRICGDYKITLNKALRPTAYPIPAINHLLADLGHAKVFAKLDLAQAYQQLAVDDETARAQTIITHKGAFKVKRLQFGINAAPGIFQAFIEQLVGGIEGVIPYFDDILIAAKSEENLLHKVRQVLEKFQSSGLRIKTQKCVIGVPSVTFLGFKIDSNGIHPSEENVRAVWQSPVPSNKRELQGFLGLVNFYHIFLKNKATVAEPLHRLLDANTPWEWGPKHEKAFKAVKSLLTSDAVLTHFDSKKPLVLTCDASPYGIGAVLSHRMPDRSEAPIAYYSRTLSATERNYAQIDREALAIVAGVKKFHDYIYGRQVEIQTDHKPLLALLSSSRPTPSIISPRMLRWNNLLSAYDYILVYRQGKSIQNADALSRLPVAEVPEQQPNERDIFLIDVMECPSLSARKIALATDKDPILSKVKTWVVTGWPKQKTSGLFQPFENRSVELSIHKGCLLWGSRIVIPPHQRKICLNMLHVAHPGIVKMKALARSYIWWPGLDSDIEKLVRSCASCQAVQHNPPKTMSAWEPEEAPWNRLHIDFAGPFQDKIFFIVVDAKSKWLEVDIVPSTSANGAIKVLRKLFATHGIPTVIVSDNGTAFTSCEFRNFLNNNGIQHITTAPFHPSSNGQAERMVQFTKQALKKMKGADMGLKLARMLISQHVTPSSATGVSPAELLMGRKLRTCIDNCYPSTKEGSIEEARRKSPNRAFRVGDPVYVRSFNSTENWTPADITDVRGNVTYSARTEDGQIIKRHTDQIRPRFPEETTAKPTNEESPPNDKSDVEEQVSDEVEPSLDAPTSNPREDRQPRIRQPPKY
ncbi:uncharacterized protein K02A2.6-like [Centruroides sculpturatus]|uniref:uncharacterized protein K02A2.6-like n=1 Tax=Centruroides sculpturatus TaxID=218467 RepID=UPI000C6CEAD0|nr:uncharacterized protein K02A2.6-like [Centruroides sculpturatus]